MLLTKNDFSKEPISYSHNYNNSHIDNNINLLDIYKNNMVKRKLKDSFNDEQLDNSKNCSISSSSYSLNFYINDKKYNKLINSIPTNLKNQNINNNYNNNNQNRSIEIINSYKNSKDKYSYMFNKKINNNNKIKLNSNSNKTQSCLKVDNYHIKNSNSNIDNNSKIKYEKRDIKIQKININMDEKNIFEKLIKDKNLTSKQKAYILLCTSPILRLKEQILFSRNPLIKNILSVTEILKNHEKILKNKINELNEEIDLCTNKLNKPFIASKIADVTLNFITSLDEHEFKDFDLLTNNKSEINLYYNFIKILYLILDEPFDKNNDNKKIKNELFLKIYKKGFHSLKDYLYFVYISNKQKFNILKNIEFINEIIKNEPDIIKKNYCFRTCRFMAFSIFLVREIINYVYSIKDTIELKIKTTQFKDIVIEKYNKIKSKNNSI